MSPVGKWYTFTTNAGYLYDSILDLMFLMATQFVFYFDILRYIWGCIATVLFPRVAMLSLEIVQGSVDVTW